jgi:hypothetical protein
VGKKKSRAKKGIPKRPRPKKPKQNALSKQQYSIIVARRREVARLLSMGWSLVEIANHVQYHVNTVCKDAQWVRSEWLKNAGLDYDHYVSTLLGKYEQASAAAWDAYWNAANRHGEINQARYLDIFVKCQDRIRELLGVDDRVKFEEARTTAESVIDAEIVEVTVRSRDELEAAKDEHGMITETQLNELRRLKHVDVEAKQQPDKRDGGDLPEDPADENSPQKEGE